MKLVVTDAGVEAARPIRGIDHVLVGVRGLEQAYDTYQRLGFTLSPRGRHIGWGTANYCVMFPNDYIELLGIIDPNQFTNNLNRFLESREGLLGLAFASDDVSLAARALHHAGIQPGDMRDLKRILEDPEGEVWPRFKLLHLPPEATPGTSAFVCQHLTPELVWQRNWTEHANGATGLIAMTSVVKDPSALAIPYAELFGFDRVRAGDGVVEVDCGGTWLRFTTAEMLGQLHPGLAGAARLPTPWLAALRLAVEDLARTATLLEHAGLPVHWDGKQVLRVPAVAACGVLLEFAETA
ncbi:VOC family protein [Pelagibius sp.]|uniref:VOC family protein n=1 Tax=Pelagibius sp. TaxID=1931238 RepID=UPI003BB06201